MKQSTISLVLADPGGSLGARVDGAPRLRQCPAEHVTEQLKKWTFLPVTMLGVNTVTSPGFTLGAVTVRFVIAAAIRNNGLYLSFVLQP